MTAAQVVAAADVLRDAAYAAETRAAHAPTAAERERAMLEAARLWTRERHMRGLVARAELRAIGRAA